MLQFRIRECFWSTDRRNASLHHKGERCRFLRWRPQSVPDVYLRRLALNPEATVAGRQHSRAASARLPYRQISSFPRKLLASCALAAVFGFFSTEQSRAQSFECGRALHQDERKVCQVPFLQQLDLELASVYRRLLLSLAKREREQLYQEEEQFVQARRRCRTQVACIEHR